jgi:sec-independent protein translocase protein TatA
MPSVGGPELIFILVIVLVVFGAGKLPEVFGQLGKGMRSFRDESSKTEASSTAKTEAGAAASASAAKPTSCASCGAGLADGAKFCAHCGKPVRLA